MSFVNRCHVPTEKLAFSSLEALKHWGLAIEYFSDEGKRITGFLYHANDDNGKLKATDDFFLNLEDLRKEHSGVNVMKLLHYQWSK